MRHSPDDADDADDAIEYLLKAHHHSLKLRDALKDLHQMEIREIEFRPIDDRDDPVEALFHDAGLIEQQIHQILAAMKHLL